MRAGRHGLRALSFLLAGLAACQPGDEPAKAGGAVTSPAIEPVAARPAPARHASFDYWLLSLSWSPEFCASSEARPNSRQCSQPREFIVHGLWPQYERGYPSSCDTHTRVSEHIADGIAELVPDRGLVFHQWKKHGSCSGMTPEAYFAAMEKAAAAVIIPRDELREAGNRTVTRQELERAFMQANPGLKSDAITFECKGTNLREVRVCLDLDLRPRHCGADVREGCGRTVSVRLSGD